MSLSTNNKNPTGPQNLRNRPVTPGRPNLNIQAHRTVEANIEPMGPASNNSSNNNNNNSNSSKNFQNNRKRSRKLLSGSLEELNKEVESLCSNEAMGDSYPITVDQNNEPLKMATTKNPSHLKEPVKIHGLEMKKSSQIGRNSNNSGGSNLLSGKSPPDGRRAPVPGAYSSSSSSHNNNSHLNRDNQRLRDRDRQRVNMANMATQQASQYLSQNFIGQQNLMSSSYSNAYSSVSNNENAVDFTSYYVNNAANRDRFGYTPFNETANTLPKKRSPTAREKLEDAYLPRSIKDQMVDSSRSNSDKSSPEHLGMGVIGSAYHSGSGNFSSSGMMNISNPHSSAVNTHIKNLANPARSPLNFFALDNNNREEPEGAESPESCISGGLNVGGVGPNKYHHPSSVLPGVKNLPISFTHEFCRRSDISVTRPKPRREQNYSQNIQESISNLSINGANNKLDSNKDNNNMNDSNNNALKLNPGLNTLNTLQQDIFNSRRPGKKYSSAFSVSSGYSSTNSNSNFSVASSRTRALPDGKHTKPRAEGASGGQTKRDLNEFPVVVGKKLDNNNKKEGSLNLNQNSVFADYTRGLN